MYADMEIYQKDQGYSGGLERRMKKKFNMVDLDCANCAAKMETVIGKIDGVKSAVVSFMAQKLTIEAEEDQFERILKEAQAAVKKVDSECYIEI